MRRKNYQEGTTATTITRPAPDVEAAGKGYLEKLKTQVSDPAALQPLGAAPTVRAAGYAPEVAAQSALTQAQQQQAATQAGYDFDPATGAVTGAGVAAYQPYLDVAGERGAAGITALGTIPGQQITAAQTAAGLAQPLLTQAGADITGAEATLGGVSPYISGHRSC